MDIYFTNEETGEEFQFPSLPNADTLEINGQTLFQEYDFLKTGEVKFPRGNNLDTLSWDGTFFNKKKRGNQEFIKLDLNPGECVKKLDKWRKDGDRIKVLITETPINDRFDIVSFTYKPQIMEEFSYSIELVQAKDVVLEVLENSDTVKVDERGPLSSEKKKAKKTIKKNDNKFRIAKRATGDGKRYKEVPNNANNGAQIEFSKEKILASKDGNKLLFIQDQINQANKFMDKYGLANVKKDYSNSKPTRKIANKQPKRGYLSEK